MKRTRGGWSIALMAAAIALSPGGSAGAEEPSAAGDEATVTPAATTPATGTNQASEVSVQPIPEMTVLVLPMRGSYAAHGEAIMKAVGQAMSTGVIRGGPFGVYHDNPDEVPEDSLRWEICVPVAAEAKADVPFEVRKMPAMEAAVVTCTGPYEGTSSCWGVLREWLGQSKRTLGGSPQEHWLSDTRSVPPEQCVARILFPLAKVQEQ